ncbi:hypothetical protein SBDP1_870024 [Syntrophobacter sp. SbD1]|nr:hypothetical protein SBDP1_870024 [Syntrophobacter sp. SbD1]
MPYVRCCDLQAPFLVVRAVEAAHAVSFQVYRHELESEIFKKSDNVPAGLAFKQV